MMGNDALATKAAAPHFEHIVTAATESFLWRLDDYPWARNVWNFHPECEIHLIRNASGVALVGDHIGEFGPGYLAVVGSNLPHDWVTPVGPGERIAGRDIVLQFCPERLRGVGRHLPEFAQLDGFLNRCQRGLAFHGSAAREGAELLERMGGLDGFSRLSLFMRLIDLLSSTCEYDVLSSPHFQPDLGGERLDTLQRALSFLFKNYTSDLRLKEVAAQAGMSESAFSRFFQRSTGNTFTNHLVELRLWQACKLLAETTDPITDICFEVGFRNISNFNRLFLRRHRITPSAYRRLSRKRRALSPTVVGGESTEREQGGR